MRKTYSAVQVRAAVCRDTLDVAAREGAELSDTMRRQAFVLLVLTVVVAVIVGAAIAGTARGIEPFVVASNPGCSDVPGLSYQTQVNFDQPQNGSNAAGVYLFVDGAKVSWYTLLPNVVVKAVIVKGGRDGNVYRYTSGQDYSDGGLYPPTNPKSGTPFALGSVRVCY